MRDIDLLIDEAWELATGQPLRARNLTEHAQKQAIERDYERGIAYSLRNMAYVHLMLSDIETALPQAEEALTHLHALNEPTGAATAICIKSLKNCWSVIYDL